MVNCSKSSMNNDSQKFFLRCWTGLRPQRGLFCLYKYINSQVQPFEHCIFPLAIQYSETHRTINSLHWTFNPHRSITGQSRWSTFKRAMLLTALQLNSICIHVVLSALCRLTGRRFCLSLTVSDCLWLQLPSKAPPKNKTFITLKFLN